MLVHTRIRMWSRFFTKSLTFGLAFVLSLFGPVSVRVVQAQGTGSVSGTVSNSNGNPVAGVRVGIYAISDLTVTSFSATDANGAYTIAGVPHSGSPYDVQLLAPCTRDQSTRVAVDGAETVNFTIPVQDKQAGYNCGPTNLAYVNGSSALSFTPNSDDGSALVSLPFSFPFAGANRTSVHVSTNGHLSFTGPSRATFNLALPTSSDPNAAIYPFWDDLLIDASAQVRTITGGVSPNRFFVIEWLNVTFSGLNQGLRLSFEAVLFQNGRIVFNYKDIDTLIEHLRERGAGATVGIENANGTAAFQRSFNQPYLENGLAFQFVPAPK